MVIIRIKHSENSQFPKKLGSENVKVLSDLKLCKILENNYNEKVEKKIEFVSFDNKNNINNIKSIFDSIKNDQHFFEHDRWDTQGYSCNSTKNRSRGTGQRNKNTTSTKTSGRTRYS